MSGTTPSLGRRMATGALWVIGSRMLLRVLGVASTIILARLLQPSDYGLIALATAFAAAVELLGSFNFEVWLVRESSPDEQHYNTVWTLSIARGAITALIILLCAEPVSDWFGEPRLTWVTIVIAFSTLLGSTKNVGIVDFQRNLQFDREFRLRAWAKFGAFLVAVAIAIWLRDYRALLAGIVTGQALNVALSYTMHDFRPRLALTHWHDAFSFSRWLLAGNVFGFVYQRSGVFILARMLGQEAVGLYAIAREIADLASSELVTPIRRVMLPGYASIHTDRELMRHGFVDVMAIIVLLALPCAAGIAVVAESLVLTTLGDRWIGAADLIQIFGIYAVSSVLMANQGPALLALGNSKLVSKITAIGVVLLIPAFITGTSLYGVKGGVVATGVTNLLLFMLSLFVTLRTLGASMRDVVRDTWRALIACMLMVAVTSNLQSEMFTSGVPAPLILLVSVVVGGSIYAGAVTVFWLAAGKPEGPERTAFDYFIPR